MKKKWINEIMINEMKNEKWKWNNENNEIIIEK